MILWGSSIQWSLFHHYVFNLSNRLRCLICMKVNHGESTEHLPHGGWMGHGVPMIHCISESRARRVNFYWRKRRRIDRRDEREAGTPGHVPPSCFHRLKNIGIPMSTLPKKISFYSMYFDSRKAGSVVNMDTESPDSSSSEQRSSTV